MESFTEQSPTLGQPELIILSKRTTTSGERRALERACLAGELIRFAPGAYYPATAWTALSGAERHRMRIHAAADGRSESIVLSHHSAAILWGLPLLDPPPRAVHVMAEPAAGGRSSANIVRHTVGIPDFTATIDGLRLTSLTRTVADLLAVVPFEAGVALADAGLRRAWLEGGDSAAQDLVTVVRLELETVAISHGRVRAEKALAFATPQSGSVAESVSRVSILRAGLTAPVLQQRFRRDDGGWWDVDFWWPDFGLIGECDGKQKYLEAELLAGRSAREVVYREKRREDALRARPEVKGFTRWDWAVGRSALRLGAQLRGAGLR